MAQTRQLGALDVKPVDPRQQGLTVELSEAWDKLEGDVETLGIANAKENPDVLKIKSSIDKPEEQAVPEEENELRENQTNKTDDKVEGDDETETPIVEEVDSQDDEQDDVISRFDSDESEDTDEDTHTRADDDDAKEDIEDLRNDPNANPKTKKSIDRLLGKIQAEKKKVREAIKAREEVEARLKALEESGVSKVSDEELKELQMLRRRYHADNDPQLKEKFDSRIEATTEGINRIIDQTLPDDQATLIKKIGFEEFTRRNPEAYREFMENLQDRSPLDADVIRSSVGEIRSLKLQKQREIKKFTEESDQYFSSITGQQVDPAEQEKLLKEQQKVLRDKIFKDITTKDSAFVLIDTSKLAGENLKIANEENKRRERYHKAVRDSLNVNNEDDIKRLVTQSALAHILADRLKSARAEIKEMKAKYDKVRQKQTTGKPHAEERRTTNERPQSFSDKLDSAAGIRSGARSIPS